MIKEVWPPERSVVKRWRVAFGAEEEPWAYCKRISCDPGGYCHQERLGNSTGTPDRAYGYEPPMESPANAVSVGAKASAAPSPMKNHFLQLRMIRMVCHLLLLKWHKATGDGSPNGHQKVKKSGRHCGLPERWLLEVIRSYTAISGLGVRRLRIFW